jgi:uncharacterized protein (DUF58 family)
MTTTELLQKIRRIEIRTKGLTKQFFTGQYHSSFKGRGMTFSEVRDYQIGDEVRTIDWNVTARYNAPYVKVFEEERELVVMLMVDISESTVYGTGERSKKELALELMAVMAFSAVENNDKVGAMFVSDQVEKFIPPAKGKKHALSILRTFIDFKPISQKTNLNEGFAFFRNCMKKRSICFVISDFMTEQNLEQSISLLRKKHDLIALGLTDKGEAQLPDLGLIQMYNAETGYTNWVNTSDQSVRDEYENTYLKQQAELTDMFSRLGIQYEPLDTNEDYIPKLIRLFKRHK